MNPPSNDRSARAFAALAAALGVTIGVAPVVLFAQNAAQPAAIKQGEARQLKGEQLKAEQLKAQQFKAEQLKAEQFKAEQFKAEQFKAEQFKAPQNEAGPAKARR